MSRFHTIVVALDFSDSAADAMDAALALSAAEPGARLHLLHVVPSPTCGGSNRRGVTAR